MKLSELQKRIAKWEELLRLFQSSKSLYYDETTLPRLSLSDLDIGAFENFLEETGQTDLGVDQKRLLKNWRLMSGNYPTIAGIIRLIKQATGNDIGIDIRDFEVLLTIPRQKASRLAAT